MRPTSRSAKKEAQKHRHAPPLRAHPIACHFALARYSLFSNSAPTVIKKGSPISLAVWLKVDPTVPSSSGARLHPQRAQQPRASATTSQQRPARSASGKRHGSSNDTLT